jgi:hypothetical protein
VSSSALHTHPHSQHRFSQNFFVVNKDFRLVFYVMAPLISSNGHRVGTLCIMGQQPRKFDATRGAILANLSELLVSYRPMPAAAVLTPTGLVLVAEAGVPAQHRPFCRPVDSSILAATDSLNCIERSQSPYVWCLLCLQVRQIERRWALQEASKFSGSRLLRTADAYESAVGFVDASRTDDWRLLHLNAPAVELLGRLLHIRPCASASSTTASSIKHSKQPCSQAQPCKSAAGAVAGSVAAVGLTHTRRHPSTCLSSCRAVSCACLLPPAGVNWRATYEELAKLSEGRHFSGWEGVSLKQLLNIDMGQAVSSFLARGALPWDNYGQHA